MKEIIFQLSANDSSIIIEREKNTRGTKFYFARFKWTSDLEDINGVSEEYHNFETPFQLIQKSYLWYEMELTIIHKDFIPFVTAELIKVLNKKNVSIIELSDTKAKFEKKLGIKLKYGYKPINNNYQQIKVQNLVKFTEYEHQEYKKQYDAATIDSKFIPKATFETWLIGDQTFQHNNVKMSSNLVEDFETEGILEVSGNTIIIKNDTGTIKHIFSSDKFFVTATPFLNHHKCWYIQSNNCSN